eukprot:CAMPEP_0183395760 /NCGR_PEP_ID=MMETSP0370-20130417/9556_1 /TAXON_ID=268820 /ORGANISM="Peridinium aciculiferum, Strain PAER-2" /LENGTH=277 /DNA_ID=CAMNT_0025576441 /DNA_START=20 /DNA_END=853 /DNA_ORIENTATION=-
MGSGPGRCSGPPQSGRNNVSALVTLNVYDLGTSGAVRALNRVLRDFGSGAFHCGVEVLGHEWSYGHCGIVSSPPRDCMGHNFSEAVTMGMTNLALKDICKMVRMLEKDWSASKYDIMTHNCCHFGNQLCLDLGVGSVPSWVMRLANTGSSVSSMAGLMTAGLRPCCCVPSQAEGYDSVVMSPQAGRNVGLPVFCFAPQIGIDERPESEERWISMVEPKDLSVAVVPKKTAGQRKGLASSVPPESYPLPDFGGSRETGWEDFRILLGANSAADKNARR